MSQSYQLNVGKYDVVEVRYTFTVHLLWMLHKPRPSSFSNVWTGSGNIFIGGQSAVTGVGGRFSGSIMEYRHWTEILNTGSFKNHIANPKATMVMCFFILQQFSTKIFF